MMNNVSMIKAYHLRACDGNVYSGYINGILVEIVGEVASVTINF